MSTLSTTTTSFPAIPSLLGPTRKRGRSTMETDFHTAVGIQVDEATSRLTSFLDTQSDRKEDPLYLALEACVAVLTSTRQHFLPKEDPIEAEKRGRSIVIELLPESTATLASDRVDADFEQVKKILDAMDIEVRPETVFRMGQKKTPSSSDPHPKPRLLKVLLPRKSSQTTFLIRSGKLKDHQMYKHIRVRPSLSEEERKTAYELRRKRDDLNSKNGKGGPLYVIYAGELMKKDDVASYKAAHPRKTSPTTPVPF
ncbi:hypothetical protein DXG03_008183 [Asterophora parasitica]|uniref:Uncharacterized protein n=1 Tax=Asterophora parasitica TaxID=117018 RepID=A0A9P7FXU5_9AGAR|nr:hypothetical protein DXG03_008183 [Asterophora parasitica]